VSIEPMPVIPVEDWQRATLDERRVFVGSWTRNGVSVFWHRSRYGWLRTGLTLSSGAWVSVYTGTRARLANFTDER